VTRFVREVKFLRTPDVRELNVITAKANASKTLEEAFDLYEQFLRFEKENKSDSVSATLIRLRSFFPDTELIVNAVKPAMALGYYTAYRTKSCPRTKRPPAVDTHRNVLAEAKTFLGWCVKKKFAPINALGEVEGVG
jgi:hypothetical protein